MAATVAIGIRDFVEHRELQGTYPVIFLSFADVKENSFEQTFFI